MDIPTAAHNPKLESEEDCTPHTFSGNPAEGSAELGSTCENQRAIPLISSGLSTPPRQRFGFRQRMESGFEDKPFKGWKERTQLRKTKKLKKNKTFGYQQSYRESQNFGGQPLHSQPNMGETQGMNYNQSSSNVNMNPGGGFIAPNINSQQGSQWSGVPPQMRGSVQQMPQMLPGQVQNQGHNTQGAVGMPNAPTNYPPNYPPPSVMPPSIPPPNFPRNVPPPNFPQQQQQHPAAPVQAHYLSGLQQYQGPPPQYNVPPPVNQYQYPSQVPQVAYANQQGPFQQFSSPSTLAQPLGYSIPQAHQSSTGQLGSTIQPVLSVQPGYAPAQAHPLPPLSPEKVAVATEEEKATSLGHPSPPPPRPKSKRPALPPNWKTATDPEGKVYYYHAVTRLVSNSVRVVVHNCLMGRCC